MEKGIEDTKKSLNKVSSLKEAVSRFVFDGCSIAFGGMGGDQVVAPTYEIIRQGQKGLTLMGDSPCEPGDFLLGTGQIKRIEVAWVAYAIAGVSPNRRQPQLQARGRAEDTAPHRGLRVLQLHHGVALSGGSARHPFHDHQVAHRLFYRAIQRHDKGYRGPLHQQADRPCSRRDA